MVVRRGRTRGRAQFANLSRRTLSPIEQYKDTTGEQCAYCHKRNIRVNKNGLLYQHNHCPGGGTEPLQTKAN